MGVEALLLVVCIALTFVIWLCLVILHQIHKFKEVYTMSTAEVLAALDAANAFTAEIASDLDALIELVGNDPEVPVAVADAVAALNDKLAEAAAKFTPEA